MFLQKINYVIIKIIFKYSLKIYYNILLMKNTSQYVNYTIGQYILNNVDNKHLIFYKIYKSLDLKKCIKFIKSKTSTRKNIEKFISGEYIRKDIKNHNPIIGYYENDKNKPVYFSACIEMLYFISSNKCKIGKCHSFNDSIFKFTFCNLVCNLGAFNKIGVPFDKLIYNNKLF